jgi:outer membrane lipoprotein-sorting protein
MKLGSKSRFGTVTGLATLLLGMAWASAQSGQTGPTERPQLSDEVFKNVQLLRGIPVKEFMGTMGFFSASLGMNCVECHVEESGGDWGRYADETDLKRTTRRMMGMVNTLNQSMFGGRRVVSCYSCHRGTNRPQVIPDLAVQYGDAIILEPDEILTQAPGAPSPDQVIDKYIQAIGGAERLARVTSFAAQGVYQGFDDYQKHPLEVYASAPGQRATIVHGGFGDSSWIFDGRNGWVGAPKVAAPVPVVPLTGGDLEGARVEAALAFPAQLKGLLVEWRVGDPAIIDDRDVHVLQGKQAPGGLPIKLYFDPMTGLLLRLVYFNQTPVGRIPTRIDYADYRDISGIRMPFKWTITWTDGRSVTEINSVQVNVPVDARRFAKPAPPV